MINLDAIQPRMMDFTLNGVDYSIPALDSLDADTLLGLVQTERVDRAEILAMFKALLEKHAPGAFESMSLAQLKALLDAWQDTGDVGESKPSSD